MRENLEQFRKIPATKTLRLKNKYIESRRSALRRYVTWSTWSQLCLGRDGCEGRDYPLGISDLKR